MKRMKGIAAALLAAALITCGGESACAGLINGKMPESTNEDSGRIIGSSAAQTEKSGADSTGKIHTEPEGQEDTLREIWLSKDQYYYQQLSEQHQAAWETDIDNALHYPNQRATATRDKRYQALASMIKTDNPRIFWIDWIDSNGRLRYETGSEATYAALEFPQGHTLSTLKETFLEAIDTAVAEIQEKLSADADRRTKAKAICTWLCNHSRYNDAQTSSHKKESDPVSFAYLAAHSAYSAIVQDDEYEPVCEGYAGAFKVLCDELGVPCISVNGSASFASVHMWNYVQLEDGGWYLVDVTNVDEAGGSDDYLMLTASRSARHAYTPWPYMNSGINPDNGYTEGAAFTVPELAEK